MNILGINAVFHESSAALLADGKLIALCEEERYSRIRHAKKATIENTDILPFFAIDRALAAGNLKYQDINLVAYSFNPKARYKSLGKVPDDPGIPENDYGSVKGEKRLYDLVMRTQELLYRHYGKKINVQFISHHLSHLASSYYSCQWDKAALLAIDGIGENDTVTWGQAENGRIKATGGLEYPNSLGFLWEIFTEYLGFSRNNDEGTVMALAAYGNPERFRTQFNELCSILPDMSFKINYRIAGFRAKGCPGLEKLFGPKREINEQLLYGGTAPLRRGATGNAENSRYADIAAGLQELTEKIIISLAKKVKEETGMKYLALSGGVALNCLANAKLAQGGIFDGIWVFPAANDAGTSFGAACIAQLETGKPPERKEWPHAFFGANDEKKTIQVRLPADISYICSGAIYKAVNHECATCDLETLQPYLDAWRYRTHPVSRCRINATATGNIQSHIQKFNAKHLNDNNLIERTAKLLSMGKIVGWFEGKTEIGPRALCHRSILADPRNKEMRNRLNSKIKHRLPFRPFGPAVTKEDAGRFFDIPESAKYLSKFMLAAIRVKPGAKKLIPAVVHKDGTTRPQLIDKKNFPRMHRLLKAFEKHTGVPMLINTSFNDREPIVCTEQDAIKTFLRTPLDALVLGNYLLKKKRERF